MTQIIQNPTVEKLTSLFKEKKLDEAKLLISSLVNRELTPEEKGALYVSFLTVYMDVVTNVNKEYKAYLEQTLVDLKKIKKAEKKINEDVKIAEVRKGLR